MTTHEESYDSTGNIMSLVCQNGKLKSNMRIFVDNMDIVGMNKINSTTLEFSYPSSSIKGVDLLSLKGIHFYNMTKEQYDNKFDRLEIHLVSGNNYNDYKLTYKKFVIDHLNALNYENRGFVQLGQDLMVRIPWDYFFGGGLSGYQYGQCQIRFIIKTKLEIDGASLILDYTYLDLDEHNKIKENHEVITTNLVYFKETTDENSMLDTELPFSNVTNGILIKPNENYHDNFDHMTISLNGHIYDKIHSDHLIMRHYLFHNYIPNDYKTIDYFFSKKTGDYEGCPNIGRIDSPRLKMQFHDYANQEVEIVGLVGNIFIRNPSGQCFRFIFGGGYCPATLEPTNDEDLEDAELSDFEFMPLEI